VRIYPAIDLTWPTAPDADTIDLVLADLDADQPTAVVEQDNGVRVFFGTATRRDTAAARVAALAPAALCTTIDVPDENWAERSQANLPPVTVGRVEVRTSEVIFAESVRPARTTPGEGVVLLIPASMGFGTGHHASTRLCLTLLQRLPIHGRRVLDVGTGSGILAIASVKLGAVSALGIDYDTDALAAAQESVDLNGERTRVSLAATDLSRDTVAGAPFEIVFANLTGALLARQASALARLVAPGGHLIASGFMVEEDADVTRAFEAAGFSAIDRVQETEWIGRIFTSPMRSTTPTAPR
jgi:ribosomal protein L11 methyltransferase